MEKVSDVFQGALLESLSRFELAVRTLTSSGLRGEKRSRRKGSSAEYADHRQYVFGDDLRRLDWHALARLDQLLIRLYAAEETLPLEVVMDTSASMDFGEPSKYVTGARVGCCLTQIALLKGIPVLWRVASEQPLEPVRMAGRNDIARVFHVLDDLIPDGKGALGATLRRSAMQGPRRRSLVVITDGYDRDELRAALRACRAAGTDVYLILVLAPEETEPGLRGEFTFVDAETGMESALTVDRAAVRRYAEMVEAFRRDWLDFCRPSGIVLFELSSLQPIGPELFRALAAGGLIQ
ncbi:MAG: DUF58 domain-containing protein [Planctomycetes bacterium]|nr:DUF58 domain-containing protein [Planctomycetota bacterium]MCL4730449.1 DUF58 domain-containing protein [Planctomycetota bacterium]